MLGSFLTVTQHEVFGHGYHGREFGFKMSYKLGINSGSTTATIYSNPKVDPNKRVMQTSAFIAGDLEANNF